MLNITKQYMNKVLSGRTYEKTGYNDRLMVHQDSGHRFAVRNIIFQYYTTHDLFTIYNLI